MPLLPVVPASAETAAVAAKVEAAPSPVKLELAAVTAGGAGPSSHAPSSTLPLPLSPDQQARIAASREAALARKKTAAVASGQSHA